MDVVLSMFERKRPVAQAFRFVVNIEGEG